MTILTIQKIADIEKFPIPKQGFPVCTNLLRKDESSFFVDSDFSPDISRRPVFSQKNVFESRFRPNAIKESVGFFGEFSVGAGWFELGFLELKMSKGCQIYESGKTKIRILKKNTS